MLTVSTTTQVLSVALATALCAGACSDVTNVTRTGDELESLNGLGINGLMMNGMSMNGMSMNGLGTNGLMMNGLMMNGLASTNGLSSTTGLMTTYGGRQVLKYFVRCALPDGQTLVKQDQYGTSYTFAGAIGVAPEALTGTCDLDCQEKISACMLAHVNNSGQHISIWLVGPDPGIGWGSSTSYPYQEGAYFGNIIANPWQGYYCAGKDMASGEVPGRLGTPMSSTVYVDPYGAGVACNKPNTCTPSTDGYTPCNDPAPMAPYTTGHKWNHVVTVWRNFEQTQMYKICNVYSGKCLGVVNDSSADGASIEQRTYSGNGGQNWQIFQIPNTNNYKIVNVASGKVLDYSGTQMVQRTYSGTASQWYPIKYIKDQPGQANLVPSSNSKSGLCVSANTDGSLVQLNTSLTSNNDRWTFFAVGPVSADTTETGTVTSGGTNPCAAFCSNPTVFTSANYQAGALGAGDVCRETTASLSGVNISNISGRTFKINGEAYTADGSISALPAKVNGGYCLQATAGGYDFASFATW